MGSLMGRTGPLLAMLLIGLATSLNAQLFPFPPLPSSSSGPTPEEQMEGIVDDETHWVKPAVSPTELLEARGYLAKEFHFTTKDGYQISVTRGRNPLINNGEAPRDGKLPILFIHGATVSASSYLLNSAAVRPRVYDDLIDFGHLSAKQLFKHVGADPARKALPFLAMNLGYEVWLMERRGMGGSRYKLGHENRTVADAFKAIPTTLIGNSMDGFSLDANMAMARPERKRYTRSASSFRHHGRHSSQQEPQEHRAIEHHNNQVPRYQEKSRPFQALDGDDETNGSHFSAKDFKRGQWKANPLKNFKPKTLGGKIVKRLIKKGMQIRRGLGPLRYANILQAFMALAKLPSTFASLVGNITTEFIQTFDPDYWRFSMDEQVEHDFPGAVDLVLRESGAQKVHAVGLSCGGAIILLSLANTPQLADKISRAVLWAPALNMGSRTDIVYLLGFVIPLVQGYIGPLPFVFLSPIIEILLQAICFAEFMQKTVCTAAVDVIMGFTGSEAPVRPFMLGNLLQPTSSGELFHLGQFARSQYPCKYNHNTKEENLRAYGHEKPPCYDLSQITLHNISFYGGTKDRLVSPDDIATTVDQMSVPTNMHIVPKPHKFNHLGCFLHEKADRLILLPSMLDIESANNLENPPKHHAGLSDHSFPPLPPLPPFPLANLFHHNEPSQQLDQHHQSSRIDSTRRSSARFIEFLDHNKLD